MPARILQLGRIVSPQRQSNLPHNIWHQNIEAMASNLMATKFRTSFHISADWWTAEFTIKLLEAVTRQACPSIASPSFCVKLPVCSYSSPCYSLHALHGTSKTVMLLQLCSRVVVQPKPKTICSRLVVKSSFPLLKGCTKAQTQSSWNLGSQAGITKEQPLNSISNCERFDGNHRDPLPANEYQV